MKTIVPFTSSLSVATIAILLTCGTVYAHAISQQTENAPAAKCVVNGALPDASCTPGAVFPGATKDKICKAGYPISIRDVSTATKNKVFAEYGITVHSGSSYEVDHEIPLELGGSNDITNLWPEAASPMPGFHEKDKLENKLHAMVCNGSLSLQDAQQQIARVWLQSYNTIFNKTSH